MSQKNPICLLQVKNISAENNVLCFDIYLLHTNSNVAKFEYAGGQYFLNFNSEIANESKPKFSIVDSDLPSNMQPRTPSIASVNGIWMLRLAVNTFPGPGAGVIISESTPGTKIASVKLETDASSFSEQSLDLSWRVPPTSITPNPVTKVFAYIDGINTDITIM